MRGLPPLRIAFSAAHLEKRVLVSPQGCDTGTRGLERPLAAPSEESMSSKITEDKRY
jgi:hypothetical protein